MKPPFASRAMIMTGIIKDFTPGALIYKDDRLRLVTDAGELFNTPLSGVQKVSWPWIQFGWGCNIWVGGKKHGISFARRTGAAQDLGMTVSAGSTVSNFAAADPEVKALMTAVAADSPRKLGKKWKAIIN